MSLMHRKFTIGEKVFVSLSHYQCWGEVIGKTDYRNEDVYIKYIILLDKPLEGSHIDEMGARGIVIGGIHLKGKWECMS